MSHFFAASLQEREEWVEAIAWCAVNSNLDNGYIVEKVRRAFEPSRPPPSPPISCDDPKAKAALRSTLRLGWFGCSSTPHGLSGAPHGLSGAPHGGRGRAVLRG